MILLIMHIPSAGARLPIACDPKLTPFMATGLNIHVLLCYRKLADETEPLAVGGFELPGDAFLKVAVAEAQSPTKAQAVGLEGTGLEYLTGGALPTGGLTSPTAAASPTLAGTGLESLISPPAGACLHAWMSQQPLLEV